MTSNIWELLAALFGGGALLKLIESVFRNLRRNKTLDSTQVMGSVDFVIQKYQKLIDDGQKRENDNTKSMQAKLTKLEQSKDELKDKYTQAVIQNMIYKNRLVQLGITEEEIEQCE